MLVCICLSMRYPVHPFPGVWWRLVVFGFQLLKSLMDRSMFHDFKARLSWRKYNPGTVKELDFYPDLITGISVGEDLISLTPTACLLSFSCFLTQELNWSLSPQTPISWLNVYMQVAYLKETDELLIPRYPQATFTQIAEVVCVSLLMNWYIIWVLH